MVREHTQASASPEDPHPFWELSTVVPAELSSVLSNQQDMGASNGMPRGCKERLSFQLREISSARQQENLCCSVEAPIMKHLGTFSCLTAKGSRLLNLPTPHSHWDPA